MNQFVLFNYSIEKNDRVIRIVFQPGTPWQDALEAIDEFKCQFMIMKEEAERKEAEEAQSKVDESIDIEVSA